MALDFEIIHLFSRYVNLKFKEIIEVIMQGIYDQFIVSLVL